MAYPLIFIVLLLLMYKLSRPFDGLQYALIIFMSIVTSIFCVDIIFPFVCLIEEYLP